MTKNTTNENKPSGGFSNFKMNTNMIENKASSGFSNFKMNTGNTSSTA